MNKGLYIHIPFCVQKCKYCDFVSFTSSCYDEYINSLIAELSLWQGEGVDTVFIGGGTPTVLPDNLMEKLLLSINNNFSVAKNTEWTVEANLKTIDADKLKMMRDLGVNRLSVGVQSFNDNELKKIGRIHSSQDAIETLELVAQFFDNYNIDLISALPEQTMESFTNTLNVAVQLNPTHISCYSLILEEGTPLYNEHKISPLNIPCEEEERAMYAKTVSFLEEHGFNQYEISNFARSGFESKHNLKYWHTDDYIGVGLAAHSLIDGIRYENTCNLKEYNNGKYKKERIILSQSDKISEYIIMALRLRKGIDERAFSDRFQKSFYNEYKDILDKYISLGFIEKTDIGYRFTQDGISISNSILCDFV